MEPDFVNKYNMVLSRIKQIDNFDGSKPQQLPEFLHKIECIMPAINAFDEHYRGILLMHIKNKCIDRAKEMVLIRSGGHNVDNWHKFKELLLHYYAEKEASYALVHKIRTTVLESTIERYFEKLSKLKQRLLNRKLTHNDTLYSIQDIERITLQVFRDHLPEPTYTMILRRNPKTMEEAYRYIVELQQQFYTQSGPMAAEEGATFSTSYRNTFGTVCMNNYSGYNLCSANKHTTKDKYVDNVAGKANYYRAYSDSAGYNRGICGSSTMSSSSNYGSKNSSMNKKYDNQKESKYSDIAKTKDVKGLLAKSAWKK